MSIIIRVTFAATLIAVGDAGEDGKKRMPFQDYFVVFTSQPEHLHALGSMVCMSLTSGRMIEIGPYSDEKMEDGPCSFVRVKAWNNSMSSDKFQTYVNSSRVEGRYRILV